VRKDAPDPEWTPEQTEKAREIAHRFGYGAANNVPSGITGGVRIVEGGLAWKIASEAEALKDEDSSRTILFAGSPDRDLEQDELTFLKDVFNVALGAKSATEYGVAKMFAHKLGDRHSEGEKVLNYGYEVTPGNPFLQAPTGQLLHTGMTENAQLVGVLRVDRENFEESPGVWKFRNRPDPEGLMRFVSRVLDAEGMPDTPVGLMTSNAYASRVVSAVSAGLDSGREVGVGMYGRTTMAKVRGTPLQEDSPLNQLPGDLRIAYDNLVKLQQKLTQPISE
jgi:hypothetical protein